MNYKFLKTNVWNNNKYDEIIDVRSPFEYSQDHIVGSKNFPVLYDNERELIGKSYQESPFSAKILGSSITSMNIANHIKESFMDKKGSWNPLIYCWRGGLRSKSMSIILSEIGWRPVQLQGGYKTYRKDVILLLNRYAPKLKLYLISGKTGTAKTKILQKIKLFGGQVLDLEDLANHKGSLLGKNIKKLQPTQKFFESLVLNEITKFNFRKKVFVEAESSKIGNLHIPKELWKNMLSSKRIQIVSEIRNRVDYLLNDYQYMCKDISFFEPAIKGLKNKINKQIILEWQNLILQKDWRKLTRSFLLNHYDPSYNTKNNLKNDKIIKLIRMKKLDDINISLAAESILNKK